MRYRIVVVFLCNKLHLLYTETYWRLVTNKTYQGGVNDGTASLLQSPWTHTVSCVCSYVRKSKTKKKIISICKPLFTCHNFNETGSCNTSTPDHSNGTELIADWCSSDMLNTVCVKHHHPIPLNKINLAIFHGPSSVLVYYLQCHSSTTAKAVSPLQTCLYTVLTWSVPISLEGHRFWLVTGMDV